MRSISVGVKCSKNYFAMLRWYLYIVWYWKVVSYLHLVTKNEMFSIPKICNMLRVMEVQIFWGKFLWSMKFKKKVCIKLVAEFAKGFSSPLGKQLGSSF